MMNSYKDQFTEWSPAYPAMFHGERVLSTRNSFEFGIVGVVSNTINSHNITINAINKAMKK